VNGRNNMGNFPRPMTEEFFQRGLPRWNELLF